MVSRASVTMASGDMSQRPLMNIALGDFQGCDFVGVPRTAKSQGCLLFFSWLGECSCVFSGQWYDCIYGGCPHHTPWLTCPARKS